ncbi:cytosine permease [Nocardia sp. CA2R105]|uniref:purine-cytosine permease family protein n=1 Tax=Nocardia coffeae TaxID=2873381 RepID=UPI001CA60D43|nr:cytosine permease [Nocardia coffeae]MBY8860899.1 cytosine permease [Nocardia coffeae]
MKMSSANPSGWSFERKGTEWVTDQERRGTPRALFWPWAGTSCNVLLVSFGPYVTALGLDWQLAALAAAVGAVLSFLLLALVSLAGQQGGAATMVAGRAAFGFHGNKIPTLISYVALVGWETFSAVLATLAARTVARRLDPNMSTTPLMVAILVTVILASAVVGMYGCHVILRIQKWFALTFTALTVVYMVLTLPNISFETHGRAGVGAFAGGVLLIASLLGLSWVNTAADYTRYLPRESGKRALVGWTTFGGTAPAVVLMGFGTLLASGDPKIAAMAETDPIAALSTHLPTWFLVPYLILALVGFVSGSIIGLYSSGLALQTLGVRIPRHYTVLIDAAVIAGAGGYVVFAAPGFFAPFQAFLTTTAVVMAAWSGIFLVDLWQRRRIGYDRTALFSPVGSYGKLNLAGIGCLTVATVIGFGLITSPDPHIGPLLGYLFTPAARAGSLGNSNLGILVALVIAIPGYAVLHRVRPPARPNPFGHNDNQTEVGDALVRS